MAVKISIACLIYKSVRWLKFVYEQVQKHTDMSNKEFYFVANDACNDVLNYLQENNIPHYIHNNTEEQRKEWYINNVYRAWNTAGRVAKGEYIVFINSDMAFTPGWLDKLENNITESSVICSRLVERGIMRSGLYGIEKNFGDRPENYLESDFVYFANSVAKNIICDGGLYMPMLIKKEHIEKIGYFPEGNVVPGSDRYHPIYAVQGESDCISGDKIFVEKLKDIGIQHKTHFNSIVYHFQQGEMMDH